MSSINQECKLLLGKFASVKSDLQDIVRLLRLELITHFPNREIYDKNEDIIIDIMRANLIGATKERFDASIEVLGRGTKPPEEGTLKAAFISFGNELYDKSPSHLLNVQSKSIFIPSDIAVLKHRMIVSFVPVTLTLVSIIQGVVLAFLATQASTYIDDYSVSGWIRAVSALIIVCGVWSEYSVVSGVFAWLPTVADVIAPFQIGVVQLFIVQGIPGRPLSFHIPIVIFWIFAFLGFFNTKMQLDRIRTKDNMLANRVLRNSIHRGFLTCGVAIPFSLAVLLLAYYFDSESAEVAWSVCTTIFPSVILFRYTYEFHITGLSSPISGDDDDSANYHETI